MTNGRNHAASFVVWLLELSMLTGDKTSQGSAAERAEFAGGYTRRQRFIETGVLLTFAGIEAYNLYHLARHVPAGAGWLVPPAIISGILGADLLSGTVHWFCDTWGSISWPVIGQSILRTFREHHFDQKAITRHDFVETNGSNALGGLLPMGFAMLVGPLVAPRDTSLGWAMLLSACTMSFFLLMTSQIHKWAHSSNDSVSLPVRLLQRSGLILSPRHHSFHHSAPYTRNYCITTGWLNPVFERFRVFQRLEQLITTVTGSEPRHDPLSDQLAAEVLRRTPAHAPLDPPAGSVPAADPALVAPRVP